MGNFTFALIFGVVVGSFFVVQQYFRTISGRNKMVIRTPDGRVAGGLGRILAGVFILFGGLATGLSWMVLSLAKAIFD